MRTASDTNGKGTRANSPVLPQPILEWMRPVLGVMGRGIWNLTQKGIENIPPDGGLIIASNHQSYLDPFLISIPIKRPLRFLAWNAALEWPVAGKLMKLMGAWPLELERSDPSAIRRSIQWLREGEALVIFPEGGRGQADGSMVRFKGGAVRMALEADVPILPVTIRGANNAWPKRNLLPRTGKVEITYHPVHHVEQLAGEETRACARRESDRLAEIIGSAL